jgi:GT2 family glycosyltransferase
MSRVPGFERVLGQPDLTAAAGPVLAVDRRKFLELGGYDPIYFPGRIEDLDLGFRGWMAGYRGYYEPRSVAYHQGLATFGHALGTAGCDRLTARNTFLFAWKNLAGLRLACHLGWIPARLAYWLVCGRIDLVLSLVAALGKWREVRAARRALEVGQGMWVERQEQFFHRFQW